MDAHFRLALDGQLTPELVKAFREYFEASERQARALERASERFAGLSVPSAPAPAEFRGNRHDRRAAAARNRRAGRRA